MNNPVLMKSRNSTSSLFDTRNKSSINSNKIKKSSINNNSTKIHIEYKNEKEINSVYNPNINSKLISMKEEISKLINDSKTAEYRNSLKQLKQYQNTNIDFNNTSKTSLKASKINNFQNSEHHSDHLEHTRISSVNSLNLTSVLEQSKHIYSLNQVFSEVNVINTISDNNKLTILLKDLKVNSIISNKCSVFKLENSYINKNNIVNEISIEDQSLVFVFYFFHSSPMIMYLSKKDMYSNISNDTGNLNTRCVVCYKDNNEAKNNEVFTSRTKDNGNNIEKSNNNNNESDEYVINTCNCKYNNDHDENNRIDKEKSNNYLSNNTKTHSLPTISSFSFQKDFSKSPAEDLLVSISFFSNSLDSKEEKLAYIMYQNNLKDFFIKAKKRLISKLNNSTAEVFYLFLKKRTIFNLLIKHNFLIFKEKIRLVKFKKQLTKIYFSSLISKITENILIKIKQTLKYRAFLLKTFFIYSKTKLKTKLEISSNLLIQNTNKDKIKRLRKTFIIRKFMRKKNKLKINYYNSKISSSVFDYLNKKKLFLVFKKNYIDSKNKVNEAIINKQVRLFFHLLVAYNYKCRMIKDKMTMLLNNKLSVEFVFKLIKKIYIGRNSADCEDAENNTLTNINLNSGCISPTNIKSQIVLLKRLPFKQQLLITESIKSKFIELLIMNSRKAKGQIEKFGYLVNKLKHRNNLLILRQNYLNYKNSIVIKKQIIKTISTQANLKIFTNKLILSTKLKQSYSYCFFILYNNCLNSYQFRQDLINKKNIIYYQLLRFRFFSFLSKLFIQKSNNKLISSKSLNYINRIKIKHYNTLNTKKDFIKKLILNDYYKKSSFINKQKINFTIIEQKVEIFNLLKQNKIKKIRLFKKVTSYFIIKRCLERLCFNINNKLFTKQVTRELISAHQRSFNFSSFYRCIKKRVYEKKKMCVLKEKLTYCLYSNSFVKFLTRVNKEIVVCVSSFSKKNINNVTNVNNCYIEEFIPDIKEFNSESISKKEDFLNSNLYSSLSNNYILLSSQFRFLNREAFSNSNRNNNFNIDNEVNINNTDYNNETNILNNNNNNINTQRTDNSKNNINQDNNLIQRLYLTTKNKLIAGFNRQVLLKYSINKLKLNAKFNKIILKLNKKQAYNRIMTSFKSFLNITRLRVIKEYQKRFFSLLIAKNNKRSFFTRIKIKSGLISLKDELKNKNVLFFKKISVIIIKRNLLENKLNKLKHSMLGNKNIRNTNKYDYYLSTDVNFISKTEMILYNNTNKSQDSSIINDNSDDNYHDNLLSPLSNSVFNTKKDFFYLLKIISFRMMIKKRQQVSFIVSLLSYYQKRFITKTKIQLTQWNSVMREFCGKVEKNIKEKKRIKIKNIDNNSLSRISRISADNKDIDIALKQSNMSNSLSMNIELKESRKNEDINEKRNISKDTEDEVRREIVSIIERNIYNKRDDINDINDKIESNINNISNDTLLSENNKTLKSNLCVSNISNNSKLSILKQKIKEFKDYFLKENSIIDFFSITAKQIKQARKIFYFHLRFNPTRNAVLKIKKMHALHYVFKISKFLRKLNFFKLLIRNSRELQINNEANDTLKNKVQTFLIKAHLLFIKKGIKAYKLYKKKKFANETRMKKNILDLLSKNRDYSKELKGYLKEAEYVDNNIEYIRDCKKKTMKSNNEIEKKINNESEGSRVSNKSSKEDDIVEKDKNKNEDNYLINTSKIKTRNKNVNTSKIVEPNVTNSSNNLVINDDFLNNDDNFTINTEEND